MLHCTLMNRRLVFAIGKRRKKVRRNLRNLRRKNPNTNCNFVNRCVVQRMRITRIHHAGRCTIDSKCCVCMRRSCRMMHNEHGSSLKCHHPMIPIRSPSSSSSHTHLYTLRRFVLWRTQSLYNFDYPPNRQNSYRVPMGSDGWLVDWLGNGKCRVYPDLRSPPSRDTRHARYCKTTEEKDWSTAGTTIFLFMCLIDSLKGVISTAFVRASSYKMLLIVSKISRSNNTRTSTAGPASRASTASVTIGYTGISTARRAYVDNLNSYTSVPSTPKDQA